MSQEILARVGLRKDAMHVDPTPQTSQRVSDFLVGPALDEAEAAGESLEIFWPFEDAQIGLWPQAEAIWCVRLVSLYASLSPSLSCQEVYTLYGIAVTANSERVPSYSLHPPSNVSRHPRTNLANMLRTSQRSGPHHLRAPYTPTICSECCLWSRRGY